MPRQLRIEYPGAIYPGAIYHIMNRGDRHEPIFRDDADHLCFLDTFSEACTKTDWQVHAYCLMLNHFHLVLETPNANLVAGMQWLLGTYTARFNRRHKLFGHLFSGRYKALIVDGSGTGYLRTACDYVHLNPTRAGLLRPEQKLREFRWSSWPEYLKRPGQRPQWLRVDRLLGEHGISKDSPAGRKHLEAGVEQRRAQEHDPDFEVIRKGWFLGDEEFRQELLEQAHARAGENHHAHTRRETTEEKARRILRQELDKLGWRQPELMRHRKGDLRKIHIARRLRTETCVTLQWIAEQLHMGTGTHVANRLYHTREK
jgi:REP element-mobilizing transposase RayT